MKVAMLAPTSWRVPPRHYGPWELVVSMLTEGLVRAGADMTLFATRDSETSATLQGVCESPYSENPQIDVKVWECLHIAHVFERAAEFDVIHNHFDFLPLSYSRLVKTPVVTTIHGFSSERIVPVYERYNDIGHYVAISEADRHPRLKYAATIHHGIPVETFKLAEEPGKYLLFFGRIHPDKGAAEAIAVARKTGMPLKMAGIIQDQRYFDEQVAPALAEGVAEFVGPVAREDRSEILGGALALLHLINFNEPFGLSVVESMACGTPVIATPRGSMNELIHNGRNGFLVRGLDEAVAAVGNADQLDRAAIREDATVRFSVERMVDEYLAVYEQAAKRASRTQGC